RVWKIGLPVRSAVLKPHAGRLVVGWVTTSESLLLYVFVFASGSLKVNPFENIHQLTDLTWNMERGQLNTNLADSLSSGS
ncbi:hypothetical protein BP00DRAFT_356978, partial [Aspergillus indologenus CBS 114.80]